MAKLKCDRHNRRVVAVNGKFIHRAGDTDECKSTFASIMGDVWTASEIREFGLIRPPRNVKNGPKLTPEEHPLQEIFAGEKDG